MLSALDPHTARDTAWQPQAVFTRSIEAFARPDLPLFQGSDELDGFEAVAGRIDGVPFTIRAYPGFPEDTAQLFLDTALSDAERERTLAAIREAFGLGALECPWQRGAVIGDGDGWRKRLQAAADTQA